MTRREKVLICIFLIVAGVFFYMKFFLYPIQEKYDRTLNEYYLLKNRVDRVEKKFKDVSFIENEIEAIKTEIFNISERYIQSPEKEEMIQVVQQLRKNKDIFISSISIRRPELMSEKDENGIVDDALKSPLELSYDKVKSLFGIGEVTEIIIEEDQEKSIVTRITIGLSLTGKFEEIEKFIGEIESYKKGLIVNSLTLNGGDSEELSCNIIIDVVISPIPEMKKEDGVKREKGRVNPFEKKEEEPVIEEDLKADFFLILKPTSADVPTMIMGLDDKKESTNIEMDSEVFIDGVLKITEENGKFYYAYSLKNIRYPQSGYEEFKPKNSGVVFLNVLSQKRNRGDLNGINMKIINETSRKFKFNRIDDSGKRFILSQWQGSVVELNNEE